MKFRVGDLCVIEARCCPACRTFNGTEVVVVHIGEVSDSSFDGTFFCAGNFVRTPPGTQMYWCSGFGGSGARDVQRCAEYELQPRKPPAEYDGNEAGEFDPLIWSPEKGLVNG